MKKTVLRVLVLLLALIALTSLPVFADAETGEGEVTHYLAGKAEQAARLGLTESEYDSLCSRIFTALQNEQNELLLSGITFPASLMEIDGGRPFMGALSDIIRSNGLYYYASLDSISYRKSGQQMTVTLIFGYMSRDKRAEIEAAAEKLLSGITGSSLSDVEKALLVHDRLAVWCEYDSVSLANNTVPEDSYSIYGTMAKRISVCQGYAESYSYLMCKLGIPTRVVNSDYANHAWNIVTLGGKDYHVDVTFDDPTYDAVGRVTHKYFLISTKRLKELDSKRGATNDFDTSPVSTTHEDGIWTRSDAAFTLLDGKIYFIDNRDDGSRDASRRKGIYEWNGGNPRQILAFADLPDNTWLTASSAYYPDSYARLSTDGTYLYFNLAKNVYRLTPGEQAVVNWTPAETEAKGTNIIGFREEDGWFIIRIGDTPNVPANPPASTLIRYQYPNVQEAPTLTGISVASGPAKTEFTVGEMPDFSGLVIRKTFSDGTTENVTAGFTFSDVDTSSAGQKTVTVTLDGKQTSFTVTVKKAPVVLTGISVVSGPAKDEFEVGEKPDYAGLVVRMTYSDGTTRDVTAGFTFSQIDTSKEGKKTVTVTLEGKQATFTITVKKAPATLTGITVSSMPAKTVYYIGENFDPAGMKLTLTMSDGTKKEITAGFEVSGFESNQAGERTLTVNYSEKTATFRVTVKTPSVKLSETLRTLEKGDSFVLRATLTPEEGSVTWTSSDPAVASVDAEGEVTALKKGTADITALFRFGSGSYRAVCRVNVTDPDAETEVPGTDVPETDPEETEAPSDKEAEKEAKAFADLVAGFGTVTEENYLEKIGAYNAIVKAKEKLSPAARDLVPDSVSEQIAACKQALDEIAEKISGRVTDAPDTGAKDTETETKSSETEPVSTDAPDTGNAVTDPEKKEEEDEEKSLRPFFSSSP